MSQRITHPDISAYLRQLTRIDHSLLEEMESVAEERNIPIIDRVSIHFIQTLLQLNTNISRILEVGTAIGYSTIWLAEAVPAAAVDTIERDDQRVKEARAYLSRAKLSNRVFVHHADATNYAEELKGYRYDVLFIDAAKGQYQKFFQQYTPLLKQDGIIITDNVLFHGQVVNEHIESKRIRSLVKKIKGYNEWLSNHPEFSTSFVPIGDGLAISTRRREK